jgi:FxLD family lantipeptide
MTVQLADPAPPATGTGTGTGSGTGTGTGQTLDDFDLDIEFIEAGGTVEHIIKMTEDNCGSSCESACTSC